MKRGVGSLRWLLLLLLFVPVNSHRSATLLQERQLKTPKVAPKASPTSTPTKRPTVAPTLAPTIAPTPPPTGAPTQAPTDAPIPASTDTPTKGATAAPTDTATETPTDSPTFVPTDVPTQLPTDAPVPIPTDTPVPPPTSEPTPDKTDSPAASPSVFPVVDSILPNWNFEENTVDPWFAFGSGVSIAVATAQGISGQYGLVSDRAAGSGWHGIAQNVIEFFLPGTSYSVSFWARLANVPESATSKIKLTMAEQALDGTWKYVTIAASTVDGLSTSWQQFTGTYNAPDEGTVSVLRLYFEGDTNGWDMAVDELIIVEDQPPSPSVTPTDSPTVSPTVAPSFSSTGAPTLSHTVAPVLPPTRTPTSAPTDVPVITPSTHSPETSTPSPATSILPNWNFEQPTIEPWLNLGSGVSVNVASSDGVSGKYALVSDRTAGSGWHGIAQNVIEYVVPGTIYAVSFWARLVNVPEGSTSEIRLTMAETALDGTVSYEQVTSSGDDGLTTSWQQFFGTYLASDEGTVSSLQLYFEGDKNGWDFAVDELVMLDDKPHVEDYFVGASANTATVVIPQPDEPDLAAPRTDCPHLAAGLTDWNTLFPWPTTGQNITIPEDTSVVVTSSISTVLGYVMVPVTSELIFAENAGGITMDAYGIDVWGALVAGSETCRYETPLTITLHGERPPGVTDLDNAMPEVYKGISVQGTLDLHGKRYFRTWTNLARRAHVGDGVLYLQDVVNWEVGQAVVLVTTAVRDSRDWHQNEVFTITSVVTEGITQPEVKAIVYIDGTVAYEHIARPEYQAEVGLLTRTIKIQGSEVDSPPTDTSTETCATKRTDGSETEIFGYDQIVCPDKYLTGYGGHVIIHDGGVSYVEGVELFRMGQTNVMARYPMHFHMLSEGCRDCYFKDSAIHESYYRCVSIHGTNGVMVSENVAYDVSGFCYYLEDGVEEENTLSFNLAAHIHVIGSPAIGMGQEVPAVTRSTDLTLPADIAASGFYITNMQNRIVGNVASGGWAGFAFPVLTQPTGPYRNLDFSPSTRVALEIDGNTAHSTANFWYNAGAFYFGGSLYYNDDGVQEYNAGRDQGRLRSFCVDNPATGQCDDSFSVVSNLRVYQIGHVGLNSWSGSMEVHGYESHDTGMAFETLAGGFWVNNMHVVCRTGEILALPIQRADYMKADGLYWYDTGQEHIMTNLYFKNCGYRSDDFNQYDVSPSRGCRNNAYNGCHHESTAFGFLTHSDSRNPEIMQATRNVTFDDVGRRFRHSVTSFESVSGRIQNWLDVDGSVSGLKEPTIVGSGMNSAGLWWNVDDDVSRDDQAPLYFVNKNGGPARGLAHVRFEWDDALHSLVDNANCTNGAIYENGERLLCNSVGHIRHLGSRFNVSNDPLGGLPITAMPEVVGLGGGFGWFMELDAGAPQTLKIMQIESTENTAVFLSIAYPLGTSFSVIAHAASWCSETCSNSCQEEFASVATVEEVRASLGNVYHFDTTTGLLTFRVSMVPTMFVGLPDWKLWNFNDLTSSGSFALRRYERDDVLLPKSSPSYFELVADCARNGAYCAELPPKTSTYDDVCSPGYIQESYDRCCLPDGSGCEYAYHPLAADTGVTVAPTSISDNILHNGDFESSRKNICPWTRLGTGTVVLEKDDTFEGSVAASISNRGNTYTGILQDITGRFEFDTTYDFAAAVKVLGSAVTTRFKVTMSIQYDGISQVDYVTVFYRSDLPSNEWVNIETSFIHPVSSLKGYPVDKLDLYFETPGHTDPFLVDDASMQVSDAAIIV